MNQSGKVTRLFRVNKFSTVSLEFLNEDLVPVVSNGLSLLSLLIKWFEILLAYFSFCTHKSKIPPLVLKLYFKEVL